MAQPARQLTQREYVQKQRRHTTDSQTMTLPKRRITKGEKLLWSLAALTLLIFGILIVSKQAVLYESSRSLSNIEQKLESTEKTNQDLQTQVQSLKQPERIIKFAKENGLKLNSKNVKIVNK
ncbi:cell division protein FtsL [Pullulanibacillus pueri]|uniref:Cell division protein FtsL n=1 Tax=Pullulanibacillus pueri TaxID=1437324 RepID=A0A8J3EJD8_9BACL|nr:cell division protein FtsL [Pullulanibacillus pueri]MBM7680126.1 cell division protein FtsL [Pullulanibacillus pueri]GGH74483.1 hypothetical protein GCM10007096_02760 [Pullulanibacillus pueri]